MTRLRIYQVDDGEEMWCVVARSEGDAIYLARTIHEVGVDDPDFPLEVVREWSDQDVFGMGFPDGIEGSLPSRCTIDLENRVVRAVVDDWMAICIEGDLVGGTVVF